MRLLGRVFAYAGAVLLVSGIALAQNPFDVSFPIAELGNCGSIDECRSFCDVPANVNACSEWAEQSGFAAKRPPAAQVETGPGGCRGRECEAYCDTPGHERECLDFAEEHGLIDEREAARTREDIERTGPGGCTDQSSCDAFCRNPDNGRTCIEFAVEEGFMTRAEADRILELTTRAQSRARQTQDGSRRRGPGQSGPMPPRIAEPKEPQIDEEKAMELIAKIGGPGGCSTFEECDTFCNTPGNDRACFEYAVEHGLIAGSEAETFKKLMDTEGPGGCRGRECEQYCETPGHERECLDFAVENGLIDPAEYEQVKKFIDLEGPGGCRGRECEQYCEDEAHNRECFAFAKENGLIPPEEAARVEKLLDIEGPGGCRGRECERYCNDPAHGQECFEFGKKHGLIPEDELRDIEEIERIHRNADERGRTREEEMRRREEMPRMRERFEQERREGRDDSAFFGPPGEGDFGGDDRFERFRPDEFGEPRQGFEGFTPRDGERPEGFAPPEAFEGDPRAFFEGRPVPFDAPPPFDGERPEGFAPPDFSSEGFSREGFPIGGEPRSFEFAPNDSEPAFSPPDEFRQFDGFAPPDEFREFHPEAFREPEFVEPFNGGSFDAPPPTFEESFFAPDASREFEPAPAGEPVSLLDLFNAAAALFVSMFGAGR